ncbi:MAG: alpha/beta hydrolase-fold protein, partial [Erysipelotrichaceae bacterium]
YASYGRAWRLHEKGLDTVIIGVSCAAGMQRLDEYAPFVNDQLQADYDWIDRAVGGKADLYLEWLVDFKAAMESRYRIKKRAGIGGSSMGGIFSLYAHLRVPNAFHGALCFSNAFWFAPQAVLTMINELKKEGPYRIYLDIGHQEKGLEHMEERYLMSNRAVFSALMELGMNLCYVEDYHGRHHESYWDARFLHAYDFLFDKEKDVA